MRSETRKSVRINYDVTYKHPTNPKASQMRYLPNTPVADPSPAGIRKEIQVKIAELKAEPLLYRGTKYAYHSLTVHLYTIYTTTEIEDYTGKDLEAFLKET